MKLLRAAQIAVLPLSLVGCGAIGGMMPTLASLIARTPADLPHVLGVTIGAVTLLYLAGALIVPETTGRLGDS